MRFAITTISGSEVKWAGLADNGPVYYGGPPPESGCWKLDMVSLEDYINKELDDGSFGESILLFEFGFQIAELESWGDYFTLRSNYVSYRPKQKRLISVGQINWPDVKDLGVQEQFNFFSEALLIAVGRVGQMKRKPRNFDVDGFLTILRSIIADCPISKATARIT